MDPIVELLNVRTDFRYRYAQKKDTHSVRAKNADCTCVSIQRKIQFNVGPCDLALFLFNAFWFSSFFGLNFKKQPHYRRISFHSHPITLCYIRSAVGLLGLPAYSFSLFAILGLSDITISDSILAINVTLDPSKRTFALYIDLDTSTSLHDGRNRKYITTMFRPCQLFFVKCRRATCIIISGLKHGKLDIQLE